MTDHSYRPRSFRTVGSTHTCAGLFDTSGLCAADAGDPAKNTEAVVTKTEATTVVKRAHTMALDREDMVLPYRDNTVETDPTDRCQRERRPDRSLAAAESEETRYGFGRRTTRTKVPAAIATSANPPKAANATAFIPVFGNDGLHGKLRMFVVW